MKRLAEEIAKTLEAALASGPAATGRRLVSEPELAKICGVSRQSLRFALESLIKDGFVVRRHGSGTYVRKVPSQEALASLPAPSFNPERIFLKDEAEAQPHEPLPSQKSMLVGATAELSLYNEINRAMLKGLKERLESLGHRLKLIPELGFDEGESLPPKGFASSLRKAGCDGFVQMANCRKRFLNGLAEAFPGKTPPPAYYVWPGAWTLSDCHPIVNMDTEDAVRLAMAKMAAKGRRRIAMIHLKHKGWSWIKDEMDGFYRWTAESLGLDYNASEAVDGHEDAGLAIKRLWSRSQKPDGIFVSDDHFLPEVASWLSKKGLEPGRDIGVVTLSNKGQPLDSSLPWSQTRFMPEQVGRLAADMLLTTIQTAGEELCSLSHKPQWIEGATH